MKTKPPLTIDKLLQWCNDMTREVSGTLHDGGLQYPSVKTTSALQKMAHLKYLRRIVHVEEDNTPYVSVLDKKANAVVWKKLT